MQYMLFDMLQTICNLVFHLYFASIKFDFYL